MAVLQTAKAHFDEAIARADALLAHAPALPEGTLRDDILRSAWMMASGASDAYFCDAYADLLSRVLRAKELQPKLKLTSKLSSLRIPVATLVGQSNGWRWRMAARQLIEKESVLSLREVKEFLRRFCRSNNDLLAEKTLEPWIIHADATKRLVGITRNNYNAAVNDAKTKARKAAGQHIERRIDSIFQRRHDCIHTCDRPKTALQGVTQDDTQKAVKDLTFLVARCHEHLTAEFPQFLIELGASGQTRNQVGA